MTTGNTTPNETVRATEPSVGAAVANGSNPPTQATPKTYTEAEWSKREAEWNKRYSGLDSKLTKVSQTFSKLQEDHVKVLEAQRSFEEMAEIKAAEAEGADPNIVRKRFERIRTADAKLAEVEKREEAVKAQELLHADIAKKIKAQELVATYQLGADAYEKLQAVENPVELENMALKLAFAKKAQDGIPTQTVDQSGKMPGGEDIHSLPFRQAIERLYS